MPGIGRGGAVGTKFKITLGKSDSFVFPFLFLGGEMKVALIACLMGWVGCLIQRSSIALN